MSSPIASERLRELLQPAAHLFGIELSIDLTRSLAVYAERLLDWNQRINLSGARDLEVLAREHIADAFALAPHLPQSGRSIDVGSGAGLPGVILALLRPDLAIMLLEPSLKRRSFLAAVARELDLGGVSLSPQRVEEHLAEHPEAYDFAVARAVFPLPEWLVIGERLVKRGGVIAGLAGGSASAPLGGEVHRYDVGAGPRAVVLVRK